MSKRSKGWLHRFIASLLIYSQFIQLAAAAVLPVSSYQAPLSPISQQWRPSAPTTPVSAGPLTPLLNYAQTGILNNLSLTNQQLGLCSPLNWGINYSDLTGTYVNAQYVLPLGEQLALGALGEYGPRQYRINGTLGYGFSPTAQIKFTAERFGQRLPFKFDSGNIESRVHQDAFGARFQQVFNSPFLQGLDFGGYYADASSKYLNSVVFTSDGGNCVGFASGLQCINYRHIAGATSRGADAGLDVLFTPWTLMSGNVYYDQVHYNPIFSHTSNEDRNGLGGGVRLNQLLGERFKLIGEASVRKIYDNYQAGLSWIPDIQQTKLGLELFFFGHHITSHNTTPDNNIVGLQVNLLMDGNKRYDERHRWGSQCLSNIAQSVITPAVKMNQVLVTAEQITKLVGPSILGLIPNSGPFAGGNIVMITGSNFLQGLRVFFGGQLATNVQILSSNSILATVPPATPMYASATVLDTVVNVLVQNPDGQQALFSQGYTYIDATTPPTIISINPTSGSVSGGTSVVITGSNFSGATSVSFGSSAATSFSVDSATQITAISPASTVGTVHITVTTPGGTSSPGNADEFTYTNLVASNPSDATQDVGQTASFSTTASGGSTPYQYQWQLSTNNGTNWSDIGGATASSYTTPTLSLSDNGNQYRVVVTDAASGTFTTAAATLTVVILPAAPVITSPVDGAIVNTATPTVTGTGDPNDTVTVYEGATLLGATTADGSGNWSLTPISPLSEGTHSLTATQTDAAGNTSAPSTAVTFTVDTITPAAPVITSPVDGAIVNTATPTVTGTSEPNATVRVYEGATLLGTTTADGNGDWSLTPSPLANGTHSLTATVTDAAGNTSVPSTAVTFTVDTIPPTAPVIISPVDGAIVNTVTPTVTGTSEPNATVRVYEGATLLGTTTADGNGDWSLTPSPLANGAHSLTATATDAAGNTSVPSTAVTFTVDTIPPAAPVITSPVDGAIVNTATPTVTGTGDPNDTVTVYEGATLLGATTADGSGNWSLTPSPLSEGTHSLTATQTNAAGNTSAPSTAVTFTVDTITPAAPVITSPVDGAIVNTATPPVTGTSEPNATVRVYEGATLLGTTTADGNGNWSLTPSPLANGTHSLTATATDAAGNTSVPSTAVTFTVDTITPTAPVIISPVDGAIVNTATPPVTGTSEPNATVRVYEGATLLGTSTADGNGNWSLTPIPLANGTHSLTATATDAAGNTSVPSTAVTFTVT